MLPSGCQTALCRALRYNRRDITDPMGGSSVQRSQLLRSTVLGLPLIAFAVTAAVAQQTPANPANNLTPVTDQMLRNPPDGDWLMWRRTYNGWGYSPLEQINKGNVKNMQLAWTWSLTPGATETTPIVHDGVL